MGLWRITWLLAFFALGSWTQGDAREATTFERMVRQYEGIRLALLHDGLDDVARAAHWIQGLTRELEAKLDEPAAGIRPGAGDELRRLLPAIRDASTQLAKAETIAAARESFGALSKALVGYRRLVDGATPAVAFCPMAQKVWLQPSGEIGNPYHGQSMARCGEFVSQ